MPSVFEIKMILSTIPDPEIPVISIEELGVLRNVEVEGEEITITITPTYTGCPAMKMIEDEIYSTLSAKGLEKVKVNTVLSPAWTTDWITDEAREKLRKYGIAPPEKTTASKAVLLGKSSDIRCPQCNSTDTVMINQFGSTPCKALYKCNNCLEPFDYFKCI
jgi:ring-1,2-phenylacetyl-CoA epoxidase subunit PaaD